ncbi:MAG: DNA topoisomerase IV subunit A [Firmicutes bacterium]|nr:DNA topoisomerase IV subunit A [Bacillota bacterium]
MIDKIFEYSLEEIMGDRFGRYAKTIIQDRAIPDVRDGLKPVQRRILYSMYKDRNTHDKPYKKSAKTVGNVMGQFHPHGDSSIYDAMVRMSQWWKQNAVYIDMHGNNGSMDGDSPAAMRYTEARLAKISNELLKDIERNTVEFAPNYDDSELEPTVLPAKFPNLLVNGSNGISAGYATNIPPHNLSEVIDATIYRIDNPNCRLDTIMNIVKGPDFPTGGIVEGLKGIKDAFETGKGKIVLKSNAKIEKDQIIVTEIPFEVNKALLVRKIDEIRVDKKIDGIAEVRDETDRDGVRIAIDLKKGCNKELVLNYLLKNTDLQITYNYNMVAIVNKRPKLLGILKILDAYIAHQREIVTRRSEFDLAHAKARLHIVDGLMKALSILDQVIETIRASKNKSDAKNNLVLEYDFTETQAEAIVMLQLYKLTNTDVTLLEQEKENLNKTIEILNKILSDEKTLLDVIKQEMRIIRKEYGVDRKTEIKEEITEIKIDTTSLITKEDVIVVVTKEGYVKKVSKKSYAASIEDETLVKKGDYVIGLYEMNTLDTLLLFTDQGNYLYIPVHELPDIKWKELGKHVSNIISIKSDENIIGSIPVYDFKKDSYITIFTKDGMVKRSKLSDYQVQRYSKPISTIKLKGDDLVTNVYEVNGNEDIFIVTNNGYGLWYDMDSVPVVGVKAAGVKSINLKDGNVVSGICFENQEYLTIITDKGNAKRIKLSELEKGRRASRGLLIFKEVKSNPQHVIKAFLLDVKKYIGIKKDEDIKNIKLTEIPIMERYSIGSLIHKSGIDDSFEIMNLMKKEDITTNNKQDKEEKKEEPKKVSLKDIDDKMMTIGDFLEDFDI